MKFVEFKRSKVWHLDAGGDPHHLISIEGSQGTSRTGTIWKIWIQVNQGHPVWSDVLASALAEKPCGAVCDWPIHRGEFTAHVTHRNPYDPSVKSDPDCIHLRIDYDHNEDYLSLAWPIEDGFPYWIEADALALHRKAANASVVLEVAGINAEREA
jgi:hypothetical protein